MNDKETKNYWSECGQVFFHYGKGYGLTDTLQTICLNNENDIKNFLESGESSGEFRPSQLRVLEQIRIDQEGESIGQSNIRTADMERAVNTGASRRKPKTTRLLASRKRLPLRLSRTKGKSLSSK